MPKLKNAKTEEKAKVLEDKAIEDTPKKKSAKTTAKKPMKRTKKYLTFKRDKMDVVEGYVKKGYKVHVKGSGDNREYIVYPRGD